MPLQIRSVALASTVEFVQAMVLDGVAQPLEAREVDDLAPGVDEAVVRLSAAAVNHRDLWIRKGTYAGLRFPVVPGSDGCGEVVAVGARADQHWLGQRVVLDPVLGWGHDQRAPGADFRILGLPDDGTFAQQVRVPAANLVAAPEHLGDHAAAALPLAGVTAYRALFSRGDIRPGDRVLLTGIGGGVAQLALLMADVVGAEVWVTSSAPEKLAAAVALGAAGGVSYRDPAWVEDLRARSGGGFQVAVDGAGGDGFGGLVELLAPGGRLVSYGATRGNPSGLDLRRVFWRQLDLMGTTMGSPDDFAAMIRFVEMHRLSPVVDSVVGLGEVESALARMDAGHQFGKLVLDCA